MNEPRKKVAVNTPFPLPWMEDKEYFSEDSDLTTIEDFIKSLREYADKTGSKYIRSDDYDDSVLFYYRDETDEEYNERTNKEEEDLKKELANDENEIKERMENIEKIKAKLKKLEPDIQRAKVKLGVPREKSNHIITEKEFYELITKMQGLAGKEWIEAAPIIDEIQKKMDSDIKLEIEFAAINHDLGEMVFRTERFEFVKQINKTEFETECYFGKKIELYISTRELTKIISSVSTGLEPGPVDYHESILEIKSEPEIA